MKNILKPAMSFAFGLSFCTIFTLPVFAQKPSSSSAGSSSAPARTTTSSPSPSPAPSASSSGGGGARSAPSVGISPSRPAGMQAQHMGGSANQGQNQGNVNRQQGNGVNRGGGGFGFAQRQGNQDIQNNNPRSSFGFPQRTGVSTTTIQAGSNNFPQRQGGGSTATPARFNNNYPQRDGFSPRMTGYRIDGPKTYIKNDYWRNNGYNHHNRGDYKRHYQPRIGFSCTVLPYGYSEFYWGDDEYYYSDGLFYEYINDEYTVVEPPVGAEVASLPANAESIVINGIQYYEAAGVYYKPYTKDDGTLVYVVAGKDGELNTQPEIRDDQPKAMQLGDIVNQLPPNCRKINVNGQKLYVSADGVYYQEISGANNTVSYKIVGLPDDEPNQN